MKICRDCLKETKQEDLVNNKVFKDGKDTLCKSCNRKRVKLWRKANPDKPHGKRDNMSVSYRNIIISALIQRDGYTCGFCGESLENSKIHIDHIVPVALGGTDTLENVRLAHASCNLKQALLVRKEKWGY